MSITEICYAIELKPNSAGRRKTESLLRVRIFFLYRSGNLLVFGLLFVLLKTKTNIFVLVDKNLNRLALTDISGK